MIDYRKLVKAGVHFGHQKARWCPKMAPYIWGYRNNVHLVDVSKTARCLENAASFLKSVASKGGTILWVGTKKPARQSIFDVADKLKMPYVNHRWIGGTLSNFAQVKKSVTKLLHYQDIIDKAKKNPIYTKKEYTLFQKMLDRLEKNVGGICKLTWPVSAIVIVDVRKERSALREAARMRIPVVALVDTNSDPSFVDYVIPGNDDAPLAIELIVNYLADSVEQGVEVAKKEAEIAAQKKKEERELAAKEKAEKSKKISEAAAKKSSVKKVVPKKNEKAPKEDAKSSAKAEKVTPVKKASAVKKATTATKKKASTAGDKPSAKKTTTTAKKKDEKADK